MTTGQRAFLAVARVALAFWMGAIACVSFVVAPILFQHKDLAQEPGKLLRPVFRTVNLYGMVAGVLCLLALIGVRKAKWRRVLLVAMILAVAAFQYVVAPHIRKGQLTGYHTLSEALWGLTLLAGVILLALGLAPRNPTD